MMQPVSIALVGIGGYPKFYVNALLDMADPASYRLVGAVDTSPERCSRLDELKDKEVPVYDTMADLFADHHPDLVVVGTGIHLHCPQTCEVLSHGSNVLCEKPLGATIQEATRMIEARDKADKFVAIGYQWSFSKVIQELKGDIMAGKFGKPVRLKTLVLWPRADSYYARNNWAGKLQRDDGTWILDSPVNNATAHYLHNMFYVLGRQVDRSARPARITAELYRANDITSYDTGIMRCFTDDGVELLYYATHAVNSLYGPVFSYEFEHATVTYEGRGTPIEARFANGDTKSYGEPFGDAQNKLWDSMKAARGEGKIVCGPEAASSQTLCVNGMHESCARIVEFPSGLIRTEGEEGERITYVEGLGDALTRCYEENKLPSELGTSWAVAGDQIDLTDYRSFPSESFSNRRN